MSDKVKGYIERKSMLYVTGVEYGDYTMNHVLGCAHGCNYPCYAFMMKRRFGSIKSQAEWRKPYLVANTLDILDKELPRLKDKIKSVHLCFTTDPFMWDYPEIADMSLEAIKKINSYGIKCTVLTKGALPIELAELSKENEYGITLVSMSEAFRKEMEPYSASLKRRLNALKRLHDKDCKTWISMEPYPSPNICNQSLEKLLDKVSFVDKIIFGRTNYSKLVSSYPGHKEFYDAKAREVIKFCKKHKIAWHIKDGTML